MTISASRSGLRSGAFGQLWWLPSDGLGNGLDDASWVPILEISERVIPRVLSELRRVGVPAYAAPSGTVADALRDRSQRPPDYRLWVGSSVYGEGESTLLALMPSLSSAPAGDSEGTQSGGGDRGWR